MKKRGISQVVTTMILILLAIIAIGIVWYVVTNIINQNSQEIDLGKIINTVKIDEAKTGVFTSSVKITNNGRDRLTQVKMVFSDGQSSIENISDVSLGQFESKKIVISLNGSMIPRSVVITPLYGNKDGAVANSDFDVDYSIDKSNGLVAYYPFEKDVNDYSGYGNNGTLKNMSKIGSDGIRANILSLSNQTQDYAQIPDSDLLDFKEGSFSYVIWVKTSSTNDVEIVFEKNDAQTVPNYNNSMLWVNTAGYAGYVARCQAGPTAIYSTVKVNDAHWHQIVVTRNNTNKIRAIYVDGSLNSQTSDVSTCHDYSTVEPLFLGLRAYENPRYQLFFNGSMDDFSVFNRSLSSEQIQHLYLSEKK